MAITQTTGTVAAQTKSNGIFNFQEESNKYITTGVTDPFLTGFLVFAVSAGLNAVTNGIGFMRKKKTGKEAVSDTFKESGKMGVCSVIGIAAGNTVAGTGLVLIAPSVLPITAGVTATYVIKHFWDMTTLGRRTYKTASSGVVRRAVKTRRTALRNTVTA